MAIENSVSNNFLSTFVGSIHVFDSCLSGVFFCIWIHHIFIQISRLRKI